MGSFSIWHWLLVGIIVLLLFGKGRFSDMMGDVAKGLKSFKKGMAEDDEPTRAAPPQQQAQGRIDALDVPQRGVEPARSEEHR